MGLFKKDENGIIASYQKLTDEQKTAFMAAIQTPAEPANEPAEPKPEDKPGEPGEPPKEPNAPTDEPVNPAEPTEPPAQNPPDGTQSEPTAQEPVAPEAPPVNYVDASTFAEAIKALEAKLTAKTQELMEMAQKGADMADRLSEEEKKAESGIGYGKLKQGINGNEPGSGKTYTQLRKETIGY